MDLLYVGLAREIAKKSESIVLVRAKRQVLFSSQNRLPFNVKRDRETQLKAVIRNRADKCEARPSARFRRRNQNTRVEYHSQFFTAHTRCRLSPVAHDGAKMAEAGVEVFRR